MTDEARSLNEGAVPTTAETDHTLGQEDFSDIDFDELVTGGLEPSEETLTTDTEEPPGEPGSAPEGAPGDEAVPKEFHKHPAWQRIMAERDEARRIADEVRRAPAAPVAPMSPPPVAEEPLPFKDINTLSEEEIAEWQATDLKGFNSNLKAQAVWESRQALQKEVQQREVMGKVQRTLEDYKSKNPDFDDLWNKGELQRYMETHPGHNIISAHMALTEESRVKAAVDAAVKAATDKQLADFKAKQQTRVLGSGPAGAPSTGEDTRLKDTIKHGGKVTVLADKLRNMRQGR
jgi:hypothetical protein